MKHLLAQQITINGHIITGPLDPSIATLGDLVNKVIIFIYPLAAIVLFFVLVLGGYDYLTSRGAADKIKAAQAKITTGIIGFVLLLLSYLVVKIVTIIFGLGGGII